MVNSRGTWKKWFLRNADLYDNGALIDRKQQIKKWDTYSWRWHRFTDDVCENGKIFKANGKNLIQFTFTKYCIVTVKIKSKKGITLLELTQDKIPIERNPVKNLYVQCSVGWTFYLANLKSVIEGGKDLRNKNVDLLMNFK